MSDRPLITLILAVRNEIRHIEGALRSLREQDAPDFDFEILVVDGASSDGTVEKVKEVAAIDSRVRLIRNSHEKTPFAFNLGVREARGEYVCIMGAHCEYDKKYISICFQELKTTGAVGCSGRVKTSPADGKWQARLVTRTLGHPFGTSRNSTHNQKGGFRDTIPYPLFKRSALLMVGGYDEQLFRNQDNDMNQRLRALGYKLYLTEKTYAKYFQKPTLRQALAHSFKSGLWNVISLRKNPRAMALRHFIPALFVLGIACGGLTGAVLGHNHGFAYASLVMLGCIGLHLFVGIAFAIGEWHDGHDCVSVALPFAWLALHASYGLGSIWGVARNKKLPISTRGSDDFEFGRASRDVKSLAAKSGVQ